MNDLNYVLDVLVNTSQLLNKRDELTEQEEQLRRDLGEAFNVISKSIDTSKEILQYINKMGVVSIAMTNIKDKVKTLSNA